MVRLAAEGCTLDATARALHVSPSTVKSVLRGVYAKLGVVGKAAAVAEALRQGMLG